MSKRRYVARGVPGGFRIWDSRANGKGRWWGDLYEVQPEELLAELNGSRRPERVAELMQAVRATKR